MREPVSLLLIVALAIATTASSQETTVARPAVVPASLDEWRALETRLQATLAKVRPAVVSLGGGSGVVVEGGYVLTAGHVIGEPGRTVTMTFDDGRRVQGTTLGVNHRSDTGLVRIEGETALPSCAMGSLDDVAAGDWCFMLGHPGGRRPAGAPLRFGRVLRPDADRFVVTDCTMSGGDSGGPLFDLDGKVIGIHSRIAVDLADNLHVPIDAFRREWDSLLASELVGAPNRRGGGANPAGQLRAVGLRVDGEVMPPLVTGVDADTPAAKAGFRTGDVVVEIDGRRFDGGESANQAPQRGRGARAMNVVVKRGDESIALTVEPERGLVEAGLRSGRGPGTALPRSARNHAEVLASFQPASAALRAHVVGVLIGDARVALGTVVRADGRVLTKASELRDGELRCELADGTRVAAKRIATDETTDLALLAIEAVDLVPVAWDTRAPDVGRVLISIGETDAVLSLGVASLPVHEPPARNGRGASVPGELGLVFLAEDDEARVLLVRAGSAAQRAGLESNDVVRAIDDVVMGSREAVIDALRDKHLGQPIAVRVQRDGAELVIEATLGERRSSRTGPRNPQEPLWGPLSGVRSGFPEVLVHDTVLAPSQCGGPLATVDGRVLGINVARAGRVESIALPAKQVVAALARLEAKARTR